MFRFAVFAAAFMPLFIGADVDLILHTERSSRWINVQFAEKERGSIETGKRADLVVTDRDYLMCPEVQMKDIQPVLTIIDGRIVYRAD